jgi:inosine/guanosine/xanthosine phosphorylase family protein
MNTDQLHAALDFVRARIPHARPVGAAILGSGWGCAAEAFVIREVIAYAAIPGMGAGAAVNGHVGRLLWADLDGAEFLIADGRRHLYEGLGWEPVAIPVFLARQLGATFMVLTNASGGIRSDLSAGSIMVVDDHINLMGAHPLAGPHDPVWGARFPDMTHVYDPALRGHADRTARDLSIAIRHGVYAAVSGPAYETPAEVRALAALGADAVGMSTVPEAILAHAAGLRVGAFSLIANAAAVPSGAPLDHAGILAQAHAQEPTLRRLLAAFLARAAAASPGVRP